MTLHEVAIQWQANGVSVVPVGTMKRATVRWKEYQARHPRLDELNEWWGNGHPWGLAIICGSVSGGLEMCEIEGRANTSSALTDIENAADELGIGEVWDRLVTGYVQQSPSGGMHLVYRISDHEVPGNEKIAHEAPSLDPKTGQTVRLVRAETRGEGGYFVGAPSPGLCHPSGEPWVLASGEYGVVPSITWSERNLIHEALRIALDESAPTSSASGTIQVAAPTASPPLPRSAPGMGAASLSPVDDWSAKTDWREILEPAGWRLSHTAGQERFWVRPGKDRGDGHSASTDYNGEPGFYIWSTSAGLETETPLTKHYILAHYQFNGDMSAAARWLRAQGYGDQRVMDMTQAELNVNVEPGDMDEEPWFSLDDSGNGMRLRWHAKDFRYVHELKQIQRFVDGQWTEDYDGGLIRAWIQLTHDTERAARQSGAEKVAKWCQQSRMMPRINAAIAMFKSQPQTTLKVSDMDNQPHLVNLVNGEYNTETHELQPHVAEHYMTRKAKARFNPEATAPKWTQFMEQVLPDETVRKYVQRAVGYSLLGTASERAFFIIHGPSGTGKSQFLSTLEYVFDTYARTAAEGTFRSSRDQGSGPTNDINDLRGKRLVTTSETAEGANFNESLMKRLTGRDSISSRGLYQENVDWTPECAIWLATNYPPRFNSDDDAIWRRAKLVPFMTRFGTDAPEVVDYARKFLYAEADGILNWILEGLHDYQENGLGEPEAVLAAAQDHREQSDSVIRFLEDMVSDGSLVEEPEAMVRTKDLYQLYEEWSRGAGEPKLGSRRFKNRIQSSGRATYARVATGSVYKGLHRNRILTHIPAELGS